jgi:phosphodiesterase/alkaline phosphatase D-like protein
MTPSAALSRRAVLQGAAAGVASIALPIRAFDEEAAAAPARNGVFGYGVASGDPTPDAVVIWTRATPPTRPGDAPALPGSGMGRPLEVTWEVARDERFRHVVRRGRRRTSPTSDHTVKVDVDGLAPYTRYWFRFRAAGQTSVVGRTQTAASGPHLHALRLALVSCSNYTGGYFTAYRAIAARDDLDLVLHVGDYIYEYGNGADRYGPDALIGTRDGVPATETIDLRGYRLRHALHKADPDLQAAHARHPWITIFDDHEVANNSWNDGAENHTPVVEGDFARRRRAAYEAYLEWMPFRLPEQRRVPHEGIRFFKRFTFGPLADLMVLETRQNRSRQVDVPGFTSQGGGFIPVGDPAIDAQLADPGRHLPEPQQLGWLERATASTDHRWHLVANQVVLAPVRWPGAVLGAPASLQLINSDQWDGYQADQQRLLEHLAAQPAAAGDTLVLTGDIHSTWAIDLPAGVVDGTYRPAGVEFVTPSVTSDGFYEIAMGQFAGQPAEVVVAATRGATAAVAATNPWVRQLDGIGHGFTIVDVTPDRVQADMHLTPVPTSAMPDPRVRPDVLPQRAFGWQTLAGSRRAVQATEEIGPRSDEPAQG